MATSVYVPAGKLAFFRDRLLVIQGRHEMRAVWERMESISLADPGSWPEIKMTDTLTINLRDRSLKQLTSDGRNEDPSWAPDGRHIGFVSNRTGAKQLWVLDIETGRTACRNVGCDNAHTTQHRRPAGECRCVGGRHAKKKRSKDHRAGGADHKTNRHPNEGNSRRSYALVRYRAASPSQSPQLSRQQWQQYCIYVESPRALS